MAKRKKLDVDELLSASNDPSQRALTNSVIDKFLAPPKTSSPNPLQNLNPVQNLNPLQSEAASKFQAPAKFEPTSKSEVANKPHLPTKIDAPKGFLQLPNHLLDSIFPDLDHAEIVVYLRLYRLSYGFGNTTCQVSVPTIAKRCKCSQNTVRTAIKTLINLGLVRTLSVTNTGFQDGGTIYEIFTFLGQAYQIKAASDFEGPSKSEPGQNFEGPSKSEANKHDDDHVLNKDHHQKQPTNLSDHEKSVMMIYQEVTGNFWSKADHTNYEKIKHIPIEKIEIAIKLAYDRATNRPNSFAFFIKEILSSVNPKTQSRSNRKKAMARIVERVRNASVGSNISPSEFVHKVKEACLREDVAFDNDLLDELMN